MNELAPHPELQDRFVRLRQSLLQANSLVIPIDTLVPSTILIDQFLGLQTTGSVVGWIQFSWAVSPLVWTGYLMNLSDSVGYIGVKTSAFILDILQGSLRLGRARLPSSRGLKPQKLIDQYRWLKGPEYLWESEENWPEAEIGEVSQNGPEVRDEVQVHSIKIVL